MIARELNRKKLNKLGEHDCTKAQLQSMIAQEHKSKVAGRVVENTSLVRTHGPR